MAAIFINQGVAAHFVLKVLKISSSTWYKRLARKIENKPNKSTGRPIEATRSRTNEIFADEQVKSMLEELRSREFFDDFGYRKLTHYLHRDYDLIINHKKVYRIYSQAKLTLPIKKKSKRRGKKICENREVTAPNQLWQFDIKYGYIAGENRFFYLCAFIDTFNREIKEYHIGTRCTAKDILMHLELALKLPGVEQSSLVIRSDNGPQMTSYQFKKKIESLGLEHEFTPPSTPNLNAYIEPFFSIVDRELFKDRFYDSFGEAYESVVKFIKHYNEVRLHGSLKMMTPKEFTKKYESDNNNGDKLVA